MKYGGIRTPLVPRPSTGISCSFAGVLSAEIVYKAAIEVGEAEKHPDVVHRLGYGPGGDGGDLKGVHLDTLRANDEPEEGDSCTWNSHLLGFKHNSACRSRSRTSRMLRLCSARVSE